MSKASEYVKKLKDIGRPEPWKSEGNESGQCFVMQDGQMNLCHLWLEPADALSLGRWIMDNYGEKETK